MTGWDVARDGMVGMPDEERPDEERPDEDGARDESHRDGHGLDETAALPAGEPLPEPAEPGETAVFEGPAGESGEPVEPTAWSGRASVPTRSPGEPEEEWYGAEPAGTPWWMPVLVGIAALVIVGILGVAIWLIAEAVGGGPAPADSPSPSPTATTPSPSPTTPPPPTAPEPEPTPSPTPSPTPEPTPTPTATPSPPPSPPPTGEAGD
jgi:hypothetical protein